MMSRLTPWIFVSVFLFGLGWTNTSGQKDPSAADTSSSQAPPTFSTISTLTTFSKLPTSVEPLNGSEHSSSPTSSSSSSTVPTTTSKSTSRSTFLSLLRVCLLESGKESSRFSSSACENANEEDLTCLLEYFVKCEIKEEKINKCKRERSDSKCETLKREEWECFCDGFDDCGQKKNLVEKCEQSQEVNERKQHCGIKSKDEMSCYTLGFESCSEKAKLTNDCGKACDGLTKTEVKCRMDGYLSCADKVEKMRTTATTGSTPFAAASTPSSAASSRALVSSKPDGDHPPAALPQSSNDCSCKTQTTESEDVCGSLCEVLRRAAPKPKSNTLEIAFGILFVILLLANVGLYLFRKAQDKRRKEKENQKMTKERKPLKGPVKTGFANKADYPALKPPEKKTVQESKVEKNAEEDPSPPSPTNKMHSKIRKAQEDLQKLRAHVKKRQAEHKSDTRSGKFQKKGPIFIPMEPDLPPPAVLPDDVVLDKVTYDPSGNEMYDIGSDVDDIEMDSSLVMDPSTLTEEEASRASQKGSKVEVKKDKEKDKATESKKKDDKEKDQKKDDKKDGKSKSNPRK